MRNVRSDTTRYIFHNLCDKSRDKNLTYILSNCFNYCVCAVKMLEIILINSAFSYCVCTVEEEKM